MNINSKELVHFIYLSLHMNINLECLGIKNYHIDQFILTSKDNYEVLFRRRKASCKFAMI